MKPPSNRVRDGVFDTVLGVLLDADRYDAHRGRVEFRGGKLVRLQIGDSRAWEDSAGLTVGFVAFPDFPRGPAGPGEYVPARGVTRVYVGGCLDTEADTGPVYLNPAPLAAGP